MASLLEEIVDRRPLSTLGKSGASLEEGTLHDTRVILKWLRASDFLSAAFGGTDRLGLLWAGGHLADLPPGIDHAMVAVEDHGPDWLVVQRDVAPWLVDPAVGISAASQARLSDRLGALQRHFADLDQRFDVGRLAEPDDYLKLLGPDHLSTVPAADDEDLPDAVRRGWAALSETFPRDVADALFDLARTPQPLTRALSAHQEPSLVHGDVFWANLAFPPDRVVFLDWSQLLGWGPPILDVAFYLGYSGHLVEGGGDAALEDYRGAAEHHGLPVTEAGVDLALLAALVGSGWNKALVIAHGDDQAEREREQAALGWWLAAARRGLEHL